ncbi:hypothetical protein [Nibrella saemangeumensis]
MKNRIRWSLVICGCMLSSLCAGQSSFSNCTAAFLGDKMVVDEYSPKGKCVVAATATGQLTLYTVNLSRTESKRVEPVPFQIAIRDKDTKTLTMYSKENLRQVDIRRVLARCRKGDAIVLLTLDNRYALPHNEILVQ